MTRFALIDKKSADGWSGDGVATVERYLPANYEVILNNDHGIVVGGEDHCGWTLDDYVLPRLGSGLIWGQEIHLGHPALVGVTA
jgi:hypothetical protein